MISANILLKGQCIQVLPKIMSTHQVPKRRSYQKLWSWWQRKAASFTPEFLVLAGIALFLWIGLTAYLTGRMPLAPNDNISATSNQNKTSTTPNNNDIEHNKLLIPFLWSIGSLLAASYLSAIKERIKASEEQHTKVQWQVSPNDLEYLSLMKHSFDDLPDKFYGLSESIDELRRKLGEIEFKKILEERFKESLARQEAVGGLNEGLEYDEKDPESFVAAIRAACDEALGESLNDREATERFYKCMYAYIRAWLVCSIQYGRSIRYDNNLPIDSIFYQDPHRKEEYLTALKSLRRKFSRKPTDKFLKTPRSRGVVDKYLEELITLIDRKNPEIDESVISGLKTTTST
jgi:hypothetical protein